MKDLSLKNKGPKSEAVNKKLAGGLDLTGTGL